MSYPEVYISDTVGSVVFVWRGMLGEAEFAIVMVYNC